MLNLINLFWFVNILTSFTIFDTAFSGFTGFRPNFASSDGAGAIGIDVPKSPSVESLDSSIMLDLISLKVLTSDGGGGLGTESSVEVFAE